MVLCRLADGAAWPGQTAFRALLAEPRCCGAAAHIAWAYSSKFNLQDEVYHYIRAQSRGSWPGEAPPPLAELSSAEVIAISRGWAEARAAALQAFHALPEQQRVPHAARIVSLLESPDPYVRVAPALQAQLTARVDAEAQPAATPATLPASVSDEGDVPAAGNKRSSDEAGLDKPAPKTPEHRSTEKDESSGAFSTGGPCPARCAQPQRVVATARTISLVVTLPDGNGATLTELECEYKVDGRRATTNTFKVDDPYAKQQIITLGVEHYLSLASRISSVRVKAKNVHGPSRTFSLAAFDDEPLCCSPLNASLEELQAELPEAERQGSRLEVLARFLDKKRQVPQLKQLAADLQIKVSQDTSKPDRIKSIVQSSSVDAALSAAVDGKQKACVDATAQLASTQREVDGKQASMDSHMKSVQRAQADADAAKKKLAEAQRAAKDTQQELDQQEKKASAAEREASAARGQHEKEEKKATKAEAELASVKLVQEALKQTAKARLPQPPPVAPATVGTSSSLGSAIPAGGRPTPSGLTPLKLKNRIKKWAESGGISKNSLQQCYKALGKPGQRDKETLISELFGGYEETISFLRLPEPIPDKKLALIYTSNKDMPPPPADGKDRAAMVDELAGWLIAKERGSPTPTAIVATLAAPAEAIVATLAPPAEAINQAAMISAVAAAATAAVASQISQPLHRQPSTLNRVKRATVRIGLFDTTTRTIFRVGSGVIIRGACGAFAQVLTCAHIFIGTKTPHTLYGGRRKEDVVILVGCYQYNDQQTSRWRHRAELVTQDPLLYKTVPFGTNGRSTLLDLAVLRVDRSIEITPSEFQGLGPPAPMYQLGPALPLFDDQNTCPLRSLGLELGSASAVTTGSAVSAAGWYSQRDEKTSTCPSRAQPAHKPRTTSRTQCVHKHLPAPIDQLTPPPVALAVFVASDFKILNKDDGLLKSNTVLDGGGSGGGQVNDSGEVIAINSMSKHVALVLNQTVQAEYASWGRSVEWLEPGHGLTS